MNDSVVWIGLLFTILQDDGLNGSLFSSCYEEYNKILDHKNKVVHLDHKSYRSKDVYLCCPET